MDYRLYLLPWQMRDKTTQANIMYICTKQLKQFVCLHSWNGCTAFVASAHTRMLAIHTHRRNNAATIQLPLPLFNSIIAIRSLSLLLVRFTIDKCLCASKNFELITHCVCFRTIMCTSLIIWSKPYAKRILTKLVHVNSDKRLSSPVCDAWLLSPNEMFEQAASMFLCPRIWQCSECCAKYVPTKMNILKTRIKWNEVY